MSDTASTAPRVPKRVAAVILNSLKGGVVPRIGLPYITVGREVEIRALLTDLSLIADGGASFRFLVGRYGAGKSFCSRPSARTPWARDSSSPMPTYPLSAACRAARTGPCHLPRAHPQHIDQDAPRGRCAQPYPGSLGRLVCRCRRVCRQCPTGPARGNGPRLRLRPHAPPLSHGRIRGDEETMSRVTKWIRGEYRTKSEARAELGLDHHQR